MYSYTELRKEHPEFIYRGYEIEESADKVGIVYDFEIPGLASFHPTWEFPKKRGEQRCFKKNGTFQKLVFSLGMVELISYWKTACPPVSSVNGGRICILTGLENSTIQTASRRTRRTLWRSGLWTEMSRGLSSL